MSFADNGGVASSLLVADITLVAGTQRIATAQMQHTNGVRVPANGVLNFTYVVTDDDMSRAVATRFEIRTSYADDSGGTGAVTFSADITPPAGVPPAPPGATASLTGTVRQGSSFLSNVLVEVRSGTNRGKAARTNGNGRYTLTGLSAGSFTLRASKSGYNASEKSTTVSGSGTLNFELSRASGGGGDDDDDDDGGGGGGGGGLPSRANPLPPLIGDKICSGSFAPSSAQCVSDRVGKPSGICGNGRYTCSDNRQGTCGPSNGGVYCYFCPGKLCNGSLSTSSEVPEPNWLLPPRASSGLIVTVEP